MLNRLRAKLRPSPATRLQLAGMPEDELERRERAFALLPKPVKDVVLVLGHGREVETAHAYADFFADATIHLLAIKPLGDDIKTHPRVKVTHCASVTDRADYLSAIPRPQIILEHGNNRRSQKVACFKQLFLFLEEDGVYVVEALDSIATPALTDSPGLNMIELLSSLSVLRLGSTKPVATDEGELAMCIGASDIAGTTAFVTKRLNHSVKLRDARANRVLKSRFGSSWGESVLSRDAETYTPVGAVTSFGTGPLKKRAQVKVPKRQLRQYRNVTCLSQQRVMLDGYYLPDTFRHPLQTRLNHRNIVNSTAYLGRNRAEVTRTRQLDGDYFFFDTEYPGHFGHVTTEVLGRVWGWREALAKAPGLKPLISLAKGKSSIPSFQADLFRAAGIDPTLIEYIQPDEAVEVSRLWAASADLAMPQFAAQQLVPLWNEIRDNLEQPKMQTYSRIFSSRRPGDIRTCLNTEEVEGIFREFGFEVIFPEDYSMAEQAKLFSEAELIAGFGGSNMFSTIFAEATPRLLVSGSGYTANNELLFAEAQGADLTCVWGDSEVNHPERGWTWAAFQSNFTVAPQLLRQALEHMTSQTLEG